MPIRVGLISAAHVHAPSFVSCLSKNPRAEFVGIYDSEPERGESLAKQFNTHSTTVLQTLLDQVDAVAIASENVHHKDHVLTAIRAGKHVLCEKPIAPNQSHADSLAQASKSSDLVLATAFPCPFSPNFELALSKIKNGDIGKVLAASTTNQGRCPFGWFTDAELSGGGAMIDHVVHISDLLRRIIGDQISHVQAQIGSNHYGGSTDDTAMVTVEFTTGEKCTIDSSWNRPSNYETWGNVRLNIVGEKGVIELDLFSQGARLTNQSGVSFVGTGSNLDALMIDDFLMAIESQGTPKSTLEDGIWASQIAIKAYESVHSQGEPAFLQ